MNWLALILNCLPNVIQLIEGFVGPGKGDVKKDLVTGLATSIATTAGASPSQVASVKDITSAATDTTVAVLNATGVFKTTPK